MPDLGKKAQKWLKWLKMPILGIFGKKGGFEAPPGPPGPVRRGCFYINPSRRGPVAPPGGSRSPSAVQARGSPE